MESIKLKKKQKLRNNEYYNLQNIFDKLYEDSKIIKNLKIFMILLLVKVI